MLSARPEEYYLLAAITSGHQVAPDGEAEATAAGSAGLASAAGRPGSLQRSICSAVTTKNLGLQQSSTFLVWLITDRPRLPEGRWHMVRHQPSADYDAASAVTSEPSRADNACTAAPVTDFNNTSRVNFVRSGRGGWTFEYQRRRRTAGDLLQVVPKLRSNLAVVEWERIKTRGIGVTVPADWDSDFRTPPRWGAIKF